jgi:alkanesulfonate monooxygenase SsuD/methylene tetrahydromethanopterin reductase-like flavin-dependent oxidoreductase (luciferase family)
MAGPTYGKNKPGDVLDFGIITGQHYRPWSDIKEQWLWADESGWDSAWAFDHFFGLRKDMDGEEGVCLEGWTLIAALATMTSQVQLGLMVTGITHREPIVLFKNAVTVDHVSDGRLILGVGAAWQEREHEAYGIPFPPPGERVDRFAEQMEMYRLLETQQRSDFKGEHYSLVNAPFEPKPVHGHIPILVGSTGKRMMTYIAKYADQWDGGGTPEEYAERGKRLNQLCEEIGRDPAEIRWVLSTGSAPFETEDAFRDHVRRYADVGVRSFLFNTPFSGVTDSMRAVADNVLPGLRKEFSGS